LQFIIFGKYTKKITTNISNNNIINYIVLIYIYKSTFYTNWSYIPEGSIIITINIFFCITTLFLVFFVVYSTDDNINFIQRLILYSPDTLKCNFNLPYRELGFIFFFIKYWFRIYSFLIFRFNSSCIHSLDFQEPCKSGMPLIVTWNLLNSLRKIAIFLSVLFGYKRNILFYSIWWFYWYGLK
jgi:hypothetical protein